MSRTTIDFGIDLGTTNSGIAVLNGVVPEIIKNSDDQDVTPSAVSFRKDGQQLVGARAKNMIIPKPDDAYAEFKRRMGTDHMYSFKSSGFTKKPEELSAEVLKALRADATSKFDEQIQAAVITVPAAFELHQCDATRKAADMAGLKGSPLLLEPVAAALAYGFQIDSEKAYWLVYDFGGGTFDAAIIKAEEGLINVVQHGGNNFLGGSDIDWAILEKLVIPKLVQNYNLPDLQRGTLRWREAIARLKRSIEIAKIELTTKTRTTLGEDCKFDDASGSSVECDDITLTQEDIISVAEPIINKSADICLKVLADCKLAASAVQKVILVGGPTKAPYFRQILKDRMGIPIDFTMDPLTVVARGAAVFAGTQKLAAKYQRRAKSGEFQIEMSKSNKSVGHEIDPLVGGKVQGDTLVEGFTIEFVNTHSQWRSGKVSLRSDGAFMLNIRAEKGERNTFSIELFDSSGTRQKSVPDTHIYTVGSVIEEQPLINSVGISLANNDIAWFFKKGAGLPLKMKSPEVFRTVHSLKVGDSGVGVRVPIIEGENEVADRNRQVGFLEITSEHIRRDLTAGSEIEVTLNINESRDILVTVYIPVLDEEFEQRLTLGKISNPNLEKEFADEVTRIEQLRKNADDKDNLSGMQRLDIIEASGLVQEIEGFVSAAKGDSDAAQKAEKLLLELKIALDEVENGIKWPKMVAQAREWLTDLGKLAQEHGTTEQVSRYEQLLEEAEKIISKKEHTRLPRKQKQVEDLYFQILFSVPAFWVNQFQRAAEQRSKMSDQIQAEKLVDMGQSFLANNNLDGLRNIVPKLWDLLPKAVVEEARRAFGSGITR